MMVRKLILILAILLSIGVVSGQACTGSTVCGEPLGADGYGAVELCENCFVCGLSDGICPSDYASGLAEDRIDRMVVYLKPEIHHSSRPSILGYNVAYLTGDSACPTLGNQTTCEDIQEYNPATELWTISSSLGCGTDLTTITEGPALRALCTDVPRTAGCENCTDPDCQATSFTGIAYDRNSGEAIEDVQLTLTPTYLGSEVTSRSAISDSDGRMSISAIQGWFNMTCQKADYSPYTATIYIQRGQNVFDCPITEGQCDGNCSVPNENSVQICRLYCEGVNGCNYNTAGLGYAVDSICDGRPFGSYVTLNRINTTHVNATSCCLGPTDALYRPIFEVSGNVKSLITRDYVRILDEEQVTAKLIVFEQE